MTGGICFKFDVSHHAVMVLPVLEAAVVVLLIAQVPLLKVLWQSCKIVLPSCAGSLAHLSPDLYTKGGSERNKTLGQLAATMV